MRKSLILVAALALTTPAFASDDETMGNMPEDLAVGTMLGEDQAAIKTALEGLGYEVRKLDMEDGAIEAYVVKDRFMAEVYVNASTGEILKVGTDD